VKPGGLAGGSASQDVVSLVKTGQRVSVHWKRAWQAYCQSFGTGMNDPARYNQDFITGFLDYAGQLAEAQLSFSGSLPFAGGGMKRTLVSGSMPPAKRFARTEKGAGPAPLGSLAHTRFRLFTARSCVHRALGTREGTAAARPGDEGGVVEFL
jgi:hypothetical protein